MPGSEAAVPSRLKKTRTDSLLAVGHCHAVMHGDALGDQPTLSAVFHLSVVFSSALHSHKLTQALH